MTDPILTALEQSVPVEDQRCGFVALVGAPNAGKSTLLNRLVGAKVSIVSPKVQTTRTRVRGIVMDGPAQVIFVDTPGIFNPRRRLDRAMVKAAWGEAEDADVVVLMVDAQKGMTEEVEAILEGLKEQKFTVFVALNKIDKLKNKEDLLALSSQLYDTGLFEGVFMVSAQNGKGVDDLFRAMAEKLPQGPWMFPEDDISDMPLRLLAAEITREKLYLQLQQELPYSATVETELWEEREDGSVRIEQTIYVERDSQKAIVLGKGGSRIKTLGRDSRVELQEIFERQVHLFLFVKVRENWGDDPNRFALWGLDHNV